MATKRDASLTRSHGVDRQAVVENPRVRPALEIDGVRDLDTMSTGGAANIYRGLQTTIGREVAIKVLNDEPTSESGQRFNRERIFTGQLSGHANIVPLFETGVTADHAPYLVMPFYRRGSLTGLMEEHGPIGWREATFLVEPIAVALAEVHCRGIVHRNLKPSTVLLTDFLLPRVGDFERALPVGHIPSQSEPDAAHFFSPTDRTAPASPSEDVYALGALLWALLAGQTYFSPTRDSDLEGLDAPTATILARQGRLPAAVEPPPQPILDLIARAMSADLLRRPANAASFVTNLRHTLAEVEEESPQRAAADGRHPLATNAAPPGLTDSRARTIASRVPDIVDKVRPGFSYGVVPDSDPESEIKSVLDTDRDLDEPTALSKRATYVLALVGCISGITLAMVAAALLVVA